MLVKAGEAAVHAPSALPAVGAPAVCSHGLWTTPTRLQPLKEPLGCQCTRLDLQKPVGGCSCHPGLRASEKAGLRVTVWRRGGL